MPIAIMAVRISIESQARTGSQLTHTPKQGDGRQEASWSELSQDDGRNRLQQDVCDEEYQDDD